MCFYFQFKPHFSKLQKGFHPFSHKNTNFLNSFQATWILKFHAFILLYKCSEGCFILDTPSDSYRLLEKRKSPNHSLCSVLSQVTINLDCKSCSLSRTGSVRAPWKAFLKWCPMLLSHLPRNQVAQPQALGAPLPSITRWAPWPTHQCTADPLGCCFSPGNLPLRCHLLALLKILLPSSCSRKLLTLLQALKSDLF